MFAYKIGMVWLLCLFPALVGMRSLDDLEPQLVPLLVSVQQLIPKKQIARTTDSLELFSGERAITNAATRAGLLAFGFDKLDGTGQENNILSKKGFKRALDLVLSIKPGGFLWAAPECSTYVWVSRSKTGRDQFNPDGDVSRKNIDAANRMVSRLTSLLLVAWTRNVHIFLEQPISSVMNFLTPLAEFLTSCLLFCTCTWLGAFGCETPKPIKVWATVKDVVALKRPRPEDKTTLVKKSNGRTYGKPDELKQSSAYPIRFGLAVANLYLKLKTEDRFSAMFDTDLAKLLDNEVDHAKTAAKKKRKRRS